MSSKLTRRAYERLIAENLEWLLAQPRTLERDHIAAVLRASPDHEYGPRAAPDTAGGGEPQECGARFSYNNDSANHRGDGPNVFDRCRLKPSHIGPHGYPVGYRRLAEKPEPPKLPDVERARDNYPKDLRHWREALPLGHRFDSMGSERDRCLVSPGGFDVCGQPRSAHER